VAKTATAGDEVHEFESGKYFGEMGFLGLR
jgi:hypothetical protein